MREISPLINQGVKSYWLEEHPAQDSVLTISSLGRVTALGYTPANDANVVKITGDQNIAGTKNFTSYLQVGYSVFNQGNTDIYRYGNDAQLVQYNAASQVHNFLRTDAANLLGASTFSGDITLAGSNTKLLLTPQYGYPAIEFGADGNAFASWRIGKIKPVAIGPSWQGAISFEVNTGTIDATTEVGRFTPSGLSVTGAGAFTGNLTVTGTGTFSNNVTINDGKVLAVYGVGNTQSISLLTFAGLGSMIKSSMTVYFVNASFAPQNFYAGVGRFNTDSSAWATYVGADATNGAYINFNASGPSAGLSLSSVDRLYPTQSMALSDNTLHLGRSDFRFASVNTVVLNATNVIASGLLDVVGDAVFGASTTRLRTYSDSTYSGLYNGASLVAAEAIYMGGGGQYFVTEGLERLRITSFGLSVTGGVSASGSGLGSAQLRAGDSGSTGYVAWLNPAGVRKGFMGYDTGHNISLTLEGTSPRFDIIGGGLYANGPITSTSTITGLNLVSNNTLTVDSGGNVPAIITSTSVADTELQIINTSAGGRIWTLASIGSAAVYGLAAGSFTIYDGTAGAVRLSVSPAGDATFAGHLTVTDNKYIKTTAGEIIAGYDPAGYFFGGGLSVHNNKNIYIGQTGGSADVFLLGANARVQGNAIVTGNSTVSGTGTFTDNLHFYSTNAGRVLWKNVTGPGDNNLYWNYYDGLSDSTKITITPAGYLGIGTTPTSPLDVRNSGGGNTITLGGGVATTHLGFDSTGGISYIDAVNTGALSIRSMGTEVGRFTSTGLSVTGTGTFSGPVSVGQYAANEIVAGPAGLHINANSGLGTFPLIVGYNGTDVFKVTYTGQTILSGTTPTLGLTTTSGTNSSSLSLINPFQTWAVENQYVGGDAVGMFRIRNSTLGVDALKIHPVNSIATFNGTVNLPAIMGQGYLQIRDNTYLDLNIGGATMMGISATVIDVLTTLRPNTDLTRDLGQSDKRWNNLYVGNVTVSNNLTVNAGRTTLTGPVWPVDWATVPVLKVKLGTGNYKAQTWVDDSDVMFAELLSTGLFQCKSYQLVGGGPVVAAGMYMDSGGNQLRLATWSGLRVDYGNGLGNPLVIDHLGAATLTGTSTALASIATGFVTKIATTLTNGLNIGGLDGTPNYGMFLQTNNSTYPLILQPAVGRLLVGQTADDGASKFQLTGTASITGSLYASTLYSNGDVWALSGSMWIIHAGSGNVVRIYAGASGQNAMTSTLPFAVRTGDNAAYQDILAGGATLTNPTWYAHTNVLNLGAVYSAVQAEGRIAWGIPSYPYGYIGMALDTGLTDSYMTFATRSANVVTERMRLRSDGALRFTALYQPTIRIVTDGLESRDFLIGPNTVTCNYGTLQLTNNWGAVWLDGATGVWLNSNMNALVYLNNADTHFYRPSAGTFGHYGDGGVVIRNKADTAYAPLVAGTTTVHGTGAALTSMVSSGYAKTLQVGIDYLGQGVITYDASDRFNTNTANTTIYAPGGVNILKLAAGQAYVDMGVTDFQFGFVDPYWVTHGFIVRKSSVDLFKVLSTGVASFSGAVGIGLTPSRGKLHIKQAGSTYLDGLAIEESGGGTDSFLSIRGDTAKFIIEATYQATGSYQPIHFRTSGIDALVLDIYREATFSRSVTATSQYNLQAYPSFIAKGSSLDTAWGGAIDFTSSAGTKYGGIRTASTSVDIQTSTKVNVVDLSGNPAPMTASTVTAGTYTVATLPAAASNTRARTFVSDSTVTYVAANIGATVVGGGANLVPVYSNGTDWLIG